MQSNPESQLIEELIFDIISDGQPYIAHSRILQAIEISGIQLSDPRLKRFIDHIEGIAKSWNFLRHPRGPELDRKAFKSCIDGDISLIKRIFTNEFLIPDFDLFCNKIYELYSHCMENSKGEVSKTLPQLERVDNNIWGLSVCTIDGQRASFGKTGVPFSMQAISAAINYALVLNDLEASEVHSFVGREPSGVTSNELCLDSSNKPHNPMVVSGAITVAALLLGGLPLADRFDYLINRYKKMSGAEYVGFNNAVFISQRATSDRDFAIGYLLKENKCLPNEEEFVDIMDFFFQVNAIECTCQSAAVMAATLASGGVCPITDERVISTDAVRDTLSLMYSCGMSDFSGQFAFKIGLPAKSSVSGVIILVVPGLLGMCLYAPRLDPKTNISHRGLQFCQELVNSYSFHNYDSQGQQAQVRGKLDPRRQSDMQRAYEVQNVLYAASRGDLTNLCRAASLGLDMDLADYDGRRALHVAAAEGHLEVCRYLVEECNVTLAPNDRWGNTPLSEAQRFRRREVVEFLTQAEEAEGALGHLGFGLRGSRILSDRQSSTSLSSTT